MQMYIKSCFEIAKFSDNICFNKYKIQFIKDLYTIL